jgi:nicotinamidase-related amidase
MLIKPEESCLLLIDMQDRLVPAMQAPARTIKNAGILLQAAKRLNVPSLVTEQYSKGLGTTVSDLAEQAGGIPVLEKMHFSCMKDQDFADTFRKLGRNQAVIAGMEAHICVLQTAVNLMEEGYQVFVVTDATSSRTAESEKACLDRLGAAGAGIVTTEMVVFEWLGKAGTEEFRELIALVK